MNPAGKANTGCVALQKQGKKEKNYCRFHFVRASGVSSKFCENISGSHKIILHMVKKKTHDNTNNIKVSSRMEGTTSLHLNETTECKAGVQESTCYIPHENHTKIQS